MRVLWVVALMLVAVPPISWGAESAEAIIEGVLPSVIEGRHDPASMDPNYWMAEPPREAAPVRRVKVVAPAAPASGGVKWDKDGHVPVLGLPEKKDEVATPAPTPVSDLANDLKASDGKHGGNLNLVPQTKAP